MFPDVEGCLEALAPSSVQHVLSNHIPELADIVTRLGPTQWNDEVTSSALVGYEKQLERMFELANGIAGEQCEVWMIGDSIEADCLPAERAGIRAIHVQREGRSPFHRCVRTLDDVFDIVHATIS